MQWIDTAAGQDLLQQEREHAGKALERIFGDQIVQIGEWGPPGFLLEAARTQFIVMLGTENGPGLSARMVANRLGVLTDSVDAVFLPHTLELSQDPHGVLREVHRILRPDGKLVVLGFNPMSWWGLRRQLSLNGYPPGVQSNISRRRLGDWLRLLNLSIDSHVACYSTTAQSRAGKSLRRLQWFASGYLLVATKETIPMTIIRPKLRRRARLVESFVNTSTRNAA